MTDEELRMQCALMVVSGGVVYWGIIGEADKLFKWVKGKDTPRDPAAPQPPDDPAPAAPRWVAADKVYFRRGGVDKMGGAPEAEFVKEALQEISRASIEDDKPKSKLFKPKARARIKALEKSFDDLAKVFAGASVVSSTPISETVGGMKLSPARVMHLDDILAVQEVIYRCFGITAPWRAPRKWGPGTRYTIKEEPSE